ncbi:MAG TPA: hypothetical protein PKE30_11480 [Niabella sp.]|nr:hypothetical protein [Niabella sp.]
MPVAYLLYIKPCSNEKNHYGVLFAIYSTFFILFGCQKTNQGLIDPNANEVVFSVEDAKNWFEQNFGISSSRGSLDTGKFRNPAPQWDNGISGQDAKWYVVEVPVKFDDVPGFSLRESGDINTAERVKENTHLLVLKSKNTGVVEVVLMHAVPKDESDNNDTALSYFNRQEFTGTFFYTSLYGIFINGWRYKGGKIIGYLKKKYIDQSDSQRVEPLEEDCVIEVIDQYARYCYYNVAKNTGREQARNPVYCTEWEYVGSTIVTTCPSEEPGPGGGGPTLPDYGEDDEIGAFYRTAAFEWQVGVLAPSQGGGGVLAKHYLVGKFFPRNPLKNKFIEGFFSGEIYKFHLGSTDFVVEETNVTVNSPTLTTTFLQGQFVFINNSKIRISNSVTKAFSEVNWPL